MSDSAIPEEKRRRVAERVRAWRERHPEYRVKARAYYEANKEHYRALWKAHYAKNEEKLLARGRTYRKQRAEHYRGLARAYAKDHAEQIKAKRRARRKANPERYRAKQRAYRKRNLEKLRSRAREYRRMNSARINAKRRAHWRKHSEELKAKQKAYWLAHPDLQKKVRLSRKARVLDLVGGGRCAICGCDDVRPLEVNHVHGGGLREAKILQESGTNLYTELLKGRRHRDDLNVLCRPCNAVDYILRKYPAFAGRWTIEWVPSPSGMEYDD